jgi:hypothetical protein
MYTSFKKILVAAITLLCGIVSAYAQTDDYVITTKGDTLKCGISLPLMGASKYTVPGSDAQKLERDEIKEYYIKRKDLRKRVVFMGDAKKADYMTVVENGAISLYEIVYTSYGQYGATSSTTDWYVGKGTDRVSALKTSGFLLGKDRKDRKDDFAIMLKDKPAVYKKYMAEDKFSFNAIRNMVRLYNTGKPLEYEVVVPKKDDAY